MQRNTHRPTTTTEANDNTSRTTTATILYIKGISENISRILQPFNIRVAHKPITTLRQLLTWTSKTKTNRGTDREQCIRLIAPTATPPTLVRLAETSQLDWPNTNERRGKAMPTISLLNITDCGITNHTIDWDSAQCLTYSTNYFQQLTLEKYANSLLEKVRYILVELGEDLNLTLLQFSFQILHQLSRKRYWFHFREEFILTLFDFEFQFSTSWAEKVNGIAAHGCLRASVIWPMFRDARALFRRISPLRQVTAQLGGENMQLMSLVCKWYRITLLPGMFSLIK